MRHGMRVYFLTIILFITSSPVFSKDIVNTVVQKYLEQKIPVDVFNQNNAPWEHGIYSINVLKNGDPSFTSTDKSIKATLPIRVDLNAKINKQIGYMNLTVGCKSRFYTNGKLELTPLLDKGYKEANATINITLPEVNMDCEGLKIPITPHLNQLIKGNKIKWEKDIKYAYKNIWKNNK